MTDSPAVTVLEWVAHNPHATYYVMAFIFVIFLVLLLWFGRRITLAERDVRSLVGFLASGDIYAIAASVLALEPTAVSQIVAAAKISPGSPIARRFSQYCQGFLLAHEPGRNLPRTARSASELFEPDAIIRESLNLRLLQAVPNVLVGIGLLFTFIGLTAALYFAGQGSTAGNVGETQASIRSLLDAASFKFASSLAALSLSIVFLFIERLLLRRFQQQMLRLVSLLDGAFPPVTSEELLRSMLDSEYFTRSAGIFLKLSHEAIGAAIGSQIGTPSDQLKSYLRDTHAIRENSDQHLKQLTILGETIATKVSEAIDSSLGARITKTFNRLDETIAAVGQTINTANQKVLKNIVDEFSQGFENRMRSTFDQMTEIAESFSDTLTARVAAIDLAFTSSSELTIRVSDQVRSNLDGLGEATAALDRVIVGTSEAVSNIAESAAPLVAASSSVKTMINSLKKSQENTAAALAHFRELSQAVDEALKSAADSTRSLGSSFQEEVRLSFEQSRIGLEVLNAGTTQSLQRISRDIADVTRSLDSLAVAAGAIAPPVGSDRQFSFVKNINRDLPDSSSAVDNPPSADRNVGEAKVQ
jgi:ABC-type transporter Mla subunit MlaD